MKLNVNLLILMDQSVEYQFVAVLLLCLSMESFCGCVSLEVGTQVISIFSTTTSILITLLYGRAALIPKLSQVKKVFYAVMALVAGLQCVFGLLLCLGAFKRRPRLMWPWLVVTTCSGLGLLGVSVTGFTALAMVGSLSTEANLVITTYVIYSLFQLYCTLVVNSRCSELTIEKRESESATKLMSPFKYA